MYDKNLKTVLHIAKSPVAGAMGNLNTCLNKYSYYNSKVFCQKPHIMISNFLCDYKDNLGQLELKKSAKEADFLHFHNCTYEDFPQIKDCLNKPIIFQLHSEPSIKMAILKRFRKHCITIAQKHATLYKSYIYTVPNMFDIYEERYMPDVKNENVITIFYSATSVASHACYENTCSGKGYHKTIEILNRIKLRYGSKVNIVTFIKEDKHIVLEAKRKADIVIDECVTGGYHISSLEGLSMGCLVINNLNEKVEKVFRNISELPYDMPIPFEISNIAGLEEKLKYLIDLKFYDPVEFDYLQKSNRNFMEMYWHPSNMVKYFEKLYDKYSYENSNPYSHLRYSNNLNRVRNDRLESKNLYDNIPLQSIQNIKNINIIKNSGNGKEALILALGPSVENVDLSKYFDKCDIFSCNYYYKKFDKNIIDYWCCIDGGAFRYAVNEIDNEAIVFANYPVKDCIEFPNSRIWLCENIKELKEYFKSNIEFERPFTVATIMLAMAIYMNYNKIYLIGVDLSLEKTAKNYCYDDSKFNSKFRDFRYNYKWIIKEFKKLNHEADIRGIKIVNLDPNPYKNLKVF